LILAAGGSSRLGRPKQIVRYRGRPLLERAVAAAAAVVSTPPVVVLGARAVQFRSLLTRSGRPCAISYNPRWRQGLAGSLRVGLDALPPRSAAVLVLLADQPLVGAAALGRLVEAWRRRPNLPAAAEYGGHLGVPAILPRRFWAALRALEGDVGARRALAAAPRVTAVPMPEAAYDVDRPEDLARLAGTPGATQPSAAERREGQASRPRNGQRQ
jgi:molybdenum cofactor cytidylyltransferase